ncbi:putative methyltransferase C9orf114 [Portunus trituberculatus]|uniref:Putative methyltransferase C9orf114 n=1 Tax=Portunus trituberculatus TaxID=210409 RepID=A0A5B7H1Q7_PORTR|nr:putative methyltransferase C9orf114 [Portunus trituberculatus]
MQKFPIAYVHSTSTSNKAMINLERQCWQTTRMSFDFKNKKRHFDNDEEYSHRQPFRRNYHNDREERSGPGGRKAPWREAQGKKKWEKELNYQFEVVESSGKPRKYTVSMAVPASILVETCIMDSLRTYVVGQIARAANIYSIDEIVVYDDKCWKKDVTSKAEIEDFIGKFMSTLFCLP